MSSSENPSGRCSSCLVGWVDQPNYRGTFDIILSCLLVVLTCSWTVLHINLPARNDRNITIYLRKARWAILAIFAPEVVTLFASCQWSSARSNIDDMHAVGVINWTTVHGFYANSGGFMLHSPDMPPFPINTQAVQYLVKKGYLEPLFGATPDSSKQCKRLSAQLWITPSFEAGYSCRRTLSPSKKVFGCIHCVRFGFRFMTIVL
jgi:hypothetical protein